MVVVSFSAIMVNRKLTDFDFDLFLVTILLEIQHLSEPLSTSYRGVQT